MARKKNKGRSYEPLEDISHEPEELMSSSPPPAAAPGGRTVREVEKRQQFSRTEAGKTKIDLIHKEERRAAAEEQSSLPPAAKIGLWPAGRRVREGERVSQARAQFATTQGAASLPQILEMLAESISTLVGPEEPVLSRESTSASHGEAVPLSAAPDPGAASHLHILRKLAHSITQIVRPQEPLLTPESTSASTPGAASHLQILHKFAESITNIATQEEPELPSHRQIFPPPAFPLPPILSPEEIEDLELIRQAKLDFIQYEEKVAREMKAKQIYPESPVEPRVRRPKPEAFHRPLSTSQTAPQTETEVPDEVIIAFVEEMEKAHQFFKFRDYLRAQGVIEIKHYSDPDDILCKFRKFQAPKMKEFTLLDLGKIWSLRKAYIFELKAEDRILKGSKARMPVNDADAHSNPVFYLLSQARQKSYVLDENLRTELKNLKIRTPLFYHDSLVSRKPTVEREARTVDVSNISNDASEKDIWEFFCMGGSIEDFECHRSNPGQIASITFNNAPAAEFALKLTHPGFSHKIRSEKLPLLVKPRSVQDASRPEPIVKEAVDVKSMLAEALNKYRELWTHYSQFQSKNGDPINKKEECSDACEWMEAPCEWMKLEALANGGYTFEGKNLLR